MAVPKKRTSSRVRNMRRAHDFITPKFMNICPNCGANHVRHTACLSCGHYRGRQVLTIKRDSATA